VKDRRPVLPPRTPGWLRDGFLRYNRALLGRKFAAVRAAGVERFPATASGPVLVYLNHPAWWDPLACAALVDACCRHRRHVALIDEAELSRVLERLGFVGIAPGSMAGARRMMRLADESAGQPDMTLWLTPQGRFADPRERPLALAGGLARLARRLPEAVAVPMALEYPFLGARKPEMRILVGEPIPASAADAATLEHGLESAMDQLAALIVRDDNGPFRTLIGPRSASESSARPDGHAAEATPARTTSAETTSAEASAGKRAGS